ncbi:MAG: FKBP-type peptidyl-prolyl cis-trans isomerase [Nanopusillaceae archaeon]
MSKWVEIEYKIYDENGNLLEETREPVIIPLGFNILHKDIEEKLKNSEYGKEYNFLLKRPFGERNPDLIKIIPISEFYKRNIIPKENLVVNVDGMIGVIRSINSGRVLVDFNHFYAGKDLVYKIKLNREVTDLKEKIVGILSLAYNISKSSFDLNIDENNKKITINLKEGNLTKEQKEIVKNFIPEIKDYNIE